jgi:hypothetical protein
MALQALTVNDLIVEAEIMSGQYGPGDIVAPNEAYYAWRKLNDLLDLLKTNRLAIYRRARVGPFTVNAGQGDITQSPAQPILIGPNAGAGNWVTPRPLWIDYAGVIYTAGAIPNPELKMHVFTMKEWKGIGVKGITSTLTRALIYDEVFDAAGNGNIYLYPVPSASFQVVLYVPVAVDEFPVDVNGNPDFTTSIFFPPAYRIMLISNLAKIISIGVVAVSADLEALATNSLADLKASNAVENMDQLSCDEATLNPGNEASMTFDWIGGGFNQGE